MFSLILVFYIFFLYCTFLAVISVCHARTATNNATSLIGAIVAFIANADKCARPNKRITEHTPPIAVFAKPPYTDARLLTAHN